MSTNWKQMAPRTEPVAKSYDFALQRRMRAKLVVLHTEPVAKSYDFALHKRMTG